MIDRKQRAAHPAIKDYAEDLINRATNEDELELTLDGAVDELTAFENRTKWAEALGKLLDKQEADLDLKKYSGEGADRGHKDELKMTLVPLRRIMNI